jgi:predicted DNA-binding transcriptional regulator AlpA
MSTKNFDALVRKGVIPKGRKRIGFKELVWYKDEIDKCKSRNKRQ